MRSSGLKCVCRRQDVRHVSVVIGNEPLSIGQLRMEERQANRSLFSVGCSYSKTIEGIGARPVGACQCGESARRPVGVAQSGRDGDQRVPGFLIGNVQMLVADEAKEMVLDDGATEC